MFGTTFFEYYLIQKYSCVLVLPAVDDLSFLCFSALLRSASYSADNGQRFTARIDGPSLLIARRSCQAVLIYLCF